MEAAACIGSRRVGGSARGAGLPAWRGFCIGLPAEHRASRVRPCGGDRGLATDRSGHGTGLPRVREEAAQPVSQAWRARSRYLKGADAVHRQSQPTGEATEGARGRPAWRARVSREAGLSQKRLPANGGRDVGTDSAAQSIGALNPPLGQGERERGRVGKPGGKAARAVPPPGRVSIRAGCRPDRAVAKRQRRRRDSRRARRSSG